MFKTEKIQIAAVRSGYWERYKRLASLYGYGRMADLFEAMIIHVETNKPTLSLMHEARPEKENATP